MKLHKQWDTDMLLNSNTTTKNQSAAFGCSHTQGVGVEENEAWPYLLNAKNFGVAGCSADYIVRIAPDLIAKNQIKTVFVLWPDWSRFDYLDNNKYVTSLPTDVNRIHFMKQHTDDWLLNNFNLQVQEFNRWCNKNNIKLVNLTLYDLIPYMDHADTWPLSKLGHHYSPEWHVRVAEIFKNADEKNIKYALRHE